MERKSNQAEMKRPFFILILLSQVYLAHGQGIPDYNARLYGSYIRGEMNEWSEILSEMSAEYERTHSQALLYDLCFAYYGYIPYLISAEEEKAARDYLEIAIPKTKDLARGLDNRHDVLALQGALLGYQIVLSKFSSMFVGPKALKYIKTAYESADVCFNCNTEMGNIKFFTPKLLGGSKTEAIPYYEKAVEILESSSLKSDRNWIYLNTVLLLANAYRETGQNGSACRLYKEMLDYEPEANWIREDLYSDCPPK